MVESQRGATEVPLGVLERCVDAVRLAACVAERGLGSTASDAGTAAAAAAAAARGAYLNVLINLDGLDDADYAVQARDRADRALQTTLTHADEVFDTIRERLVRALD